MLCGGNATIVAWQNNEIVAEVPSACTGVRGEMKIWVYKTAQDVLNSTVSREKSYKATMCPCCPKLSAAEPPDTCVAMDDTDQSMVCTMFGDPHFVTFSQKRHHAQVASQ